MFQDKLGGFIFKFKTILLFSKNIFNKKTTASLNFQVFCFKINLEALVSSFYFLFSKKIFNKKTTASFNFQVLCFKINLAALVSSFYFLFSKNFFNKINKEQQVLTLKFYVLR